MELGQELRPSFVFFSGRFHVVWQIIEMAADVVECCALAKRVALRLAGALVDDTLPEAHSRDEVACLSFGEDVTNR